MVSPDITVLDVGHGNAAVLHHPSATVVIDAGHGDTVLEHLSRQDIGSIHAILLSHADSDHIGGAAAILASEAIQVAHLFLNPDVTKETNAWYDLRVSVRDARQRGELAVSPQLTTTVRLEFTDPYVLIEVLAPFPEVALGGVGGKDLQERRLTSNTMSAVIRVSSDAGPMILLPGDLDQTGLSNIIEQNVDLKARVLVFPHHGGLTSGPQPANFAAELVKRVEPQMVIFSIGRGLYSTPRPEIIAAIRDTLPEVHIACTELSEHCAATLPADEPVHLAPVLARASRARSCCAGSVVIPLDEAHQTLPLVDDHLAFIRAHAPTSLCLKTKQSSAN